mmetsp:Transcript_33983/g.90081  ORF Transcript_33983/g.90081 Transcript_33983/m.90081 type:complete len:188 (-) Transcript_33983:260-823(-)
METIARRVSMEERLCTSVLEIISMLTFHTQRRIDETCDACSQTWLHLVLFSTCQVLAICAGFRLHSTNVTGHNTWNEYEWWWGFQDFFHIGGGVVLLLVAMGLYCAVTASFNRVPTRALKLFAEAKAPLVRQFQIQGCLKTRKYGMHILWGQVFIDCSKAFLFFVILFISVVASVMALMNETDMMLD